VIYILPQLITETFLFSTKKTSSSHDEDWNQVENSWEHFNKKLIALMDTLLVKSVFLILLIVFLGEFTLWLSLAYVLFIRSWIPDFFQTFFSLKSALDEVFVTYLITTVLTTLLLNRIITYSVAKRYGALPINKKDKK